MDKITLEKVGPDNRPRIAASAVSRIRRTRGMSPKVEWAAQALCEGLRYLLFRDEKGGPLAFLEYVPVNTLGVRWTPRAGCSCIVCGYTPQDKREAGWAAV